jgi:LysM repeat protein
VRLFRLSRKPGSGEEERELVLHTDAEAPPDTTSSTAPADGESEGRQSSPPSEPEDIPVQDLLSDLVGVSHRLGITPRAPPEPSVDELPDVDAEPSGDEPSVDELPDVDAEPSVDEPGVDEPADVDAEPSGDEPTGDEPPAVDAQPSEEEDTAEPDASEGPLAALSPTGYRRYALHVLLLGLALVAAIVGLIGAGQLARTALPQSSPDDVQARHSRPPIFVATLTASGEDQAQAAATPAPEVTPVPAPQLQPAYFLYTVQAGDAIIAIAETFAITPDYILWNNPDVIEDPNLLHVGQELLIPSVDGIIYRVKPGDTLPDIAALYQIDVESILAFAPNGLTSADSAIEGMVLILPGAVPPLLPRPPEVVEPTASEPQPTEPAPTPEAPTPSEPQAMEPTPTPEDSPSFSIGHIWP